MPICLNASHNSYTDIIAIRYTSLTDLGLTNWQMSNFFVEKYVIILKVELYLQEKHYICTTNYNNIIMETKDLNRLKVVLAEKKRTNKWLAEQLGKDPATVSKWCTNSAQPNLENLMEIAKVLEVDVNELLRMQ